jgi:hypothetical protein
MSIGAFNQLVGDMTGYGHPKHGGLGYEPYCGPCHLRPASTGSPRTVSPRPESPPMAPVAVWAARRAPEGSPRG